MVRAKCKRIGCGNPQYAGKMCLIHYKKEMKIPTNIPLVITKKKGDSDAKKH